MNGGQDQRRNKGTISCQSGACKSELMHARVDDISLAVIRAPSVEEKILLKNGPVYWIHLHIVFGA